MAKVNHEHHVLILVFTHIGILKIFRKVVCIIHRYYLFFSTATVTISESVNYRIILTNWKFPEPIVTKVLK